MSIAIATTILEDREFVSSFLALSQTRLSESRAYTTQILDAADIEYAKPGYVHGCSFSTVD